MPNIQVFNVDCIAGLAAHVTDASIDLMVSSIPFGSLFSYTHSPEDIGNNHDGVDMRGSQFGLHFRFFLAQLFRVLKPGCNACIHIQQLLRYQNEHGYIGRRDFRGAVVDMAAAAGFEWKGEVVIPKNPQIIAQRLKLHSLMFVTGKRNARDLAPAVNDYVLIFQKPGECAPVTALHDPKANPDGWVSTNEWIRDAYGVWRNEDLLTKRLDTLRTGADKHHVPGLARFASENELLIGWRDAQDRLAEYDWLATGIWDDIQETDVLDNWRGAREDGDEKHVCPLQLEVIRRLMRLYSNPGETVLDPFSGIGSTGFVCIEQGRNYVGFELKQSYYEMSLKNLDLARARHQEELAPLFAYAQTVNAQKPR